MTSPQITFRNSLMSQALEEMTSGRLDQVQAYVALLGAAAAVAATLKPDARRTLIEQSEGHMLARANAIAADIRSGKFDQEVAGH